MALMPSPELLAFLNHLGLQWPEANEDQLREVAGYYRDAGSELGKVKDLFLLVAQDISKEFAGQTADSFLQLINQLCSGDSPYLDAGKDQANQMAAVADQTATDVEYSKWMIIAELVVMFVQIMVMLILMEMFPILGGILMPQVEWTMFLGREAILQIIKALITNIAVQSAIGAGLNSLMSWALQFQQIQDGHRSGYDTSLISEAAVTGAIGGAVAAPFDIIGMGLGKVLGDAIGAVGSAFKLGGKEGFFGINQGIAGTIGGLLTKGGAHDAGGLAVQEGSRAATASVLPNARNGAAALAKDVGWAINRRHGSFASSFGDYGATAPRGSFAGGFVSDFGRALDKHLGAGDFGQQWARAVTANWGLGEADQAAVRAAVQDVVNTFRHQLGDQGADFFSHDLPEAIRSWASSGKPHASVRYQASSILAGGFTDGLNQNLSGGISSAIYNGGFTFTLEGFVGGAVMGLGARSVTDVVVLPALKAAGFLKGHGYPGEAGNTNGTSPGAGSAGGPAGPPVPPPTASSTDSGARGTVPPGPAAPRSTTPVPNETSTGSTTSAEVRLPTPTPTESTSTAPVPNEGGSAGGAGSVPAGGTGEGPVPVQVDSEAPATVTGGGTPSSHGATPERTPPSTPSGSGDTGRRTTSLPGSGPRQETTSQGGTLREGSPESPAPAPAPTTRPATTSADGSARQGSPESSAPAPDSRTHPATTSADGSTQQISPENPASVPTGSGESQPVTTPEPWHPAATGGHGGFAGDSAVHRHVDGLTQARDHPRATTSTATEGRNTAEPREQAPNGTAGGSHDTAPLRPLTLRERQEWVQYQVLDARAAHRALHQGDASALPFDERGARESAERFLDELHQDLAGRFNVSGEADKYFTRPPAWTAENPTAARQWHDQQVYLTGLRDAEFGQAKDDLGRAQHFEDTFAEWMRQHAASQQVSAPRPHGSPAGAGERNGSPGDHAAGPGGETRDRQQGPEQTPEQTPDQTAGKTAQGGDGTEHAPSPSHPGTGGRDELLAQLRESVREQFLRRVDDGGGDPFPTQEALLRHLDEEWAVLQGVAQANHLADSLLEEWRTGLPPEQRQLLDDPDVRLDVLTRVHEALEPSQRALMKQLLDAAGPHATPQKVVDDISRVVQAELSGRSGTSREQSNLPPVAAPVRQAVRQLATRLSTLHDVFRDVLGDVTAHHDALGWFEQAADTAGSAPHPPGVGDGGGNAMVRQQGSRLSPGGRDRLRETWLARFEQDRRTVFGTPGTPGRRGAAGREAAQRWQGLRGDRTRQLAEELTLQVVKEDAARHAVEAVTEAASEHHPENEPGPLGAAFHQEFGPGAGGPSPKATRRAAYALGSDIHQALDRWAAAPAPARDPAGAAAIIRAFTDPSAIRRRLAVEVAREAVETQAHAEAREFLAARMPGVLGDAADRFVTGHAERVTALFDGIFGHGPDAPPPGSGPRDTVVDAGKLDTWRDGRSSHTEELGHHLDFEVSATGGVQTWADGFHSTAADSGLSEDDLQRIGGQTQKDWFNAYHDIWDGPKGLDTEAWLAHENEHGGRFHPRPLDGSSQGPVPAVSPGDLRLLRPETATGPVEFSTSPRPSGEEQPAPSSVERPVEPSAKTSVDPSVTETGQTDRQPQEVPHDDVSRQQDQGPLDEGGKGTEDSVGPRDPGSQMASDSGSGPDSAPGPVSAVAEGKRPVPYDVQVREWHQDAQREYQEALDELHRAQERVDTAERIAANHVGPGPSRDRAVERALDQMNEAWSRVNEAWSRLQRTARALDELPRNEETNQPDEINRPQDTSQPGETSRPPRIGPPQYTGGRPETREVTPEKPAWQNEDTQPTQADYIARELLGNREAQEPPAQEQPPAGTGPEHTPQERTPEPTDQEPITHQDQSGQEQTGHDRLDSEPAAGTAKSAPKVLRGPAEPEPAQDSRDRSPGAGQETAEEVPAPQEAPVTAGTLGEVPVPPLGFADVVDSATQAYFSFGTLGRAHSFADVDLADPAAVADLVAGLIPQDSPASVLVPDIRSQVTALVTSSNPRTIVQHLLEDGIHMSVHAPGGERWPVTLRLNGVQRDQAVYVAPTPNGGALTSLPHGATHGTPQEATSTHGTGASNSVNNSANIDLSALVSIAHGSAVVMPTGGVSGSGGVGRGQSHGTNAQSRVLAKFAGANDVFDFSGATLYLDTRSPQGDWLEFLRQGPLRLSFPTELTHPVRPQGAQLWRLPDPRDLNRIPSSRLTAAMDEHFPVVQDIGGLQRLRQSLLNHYKLRGQNEVGTALHDYAHAWFSELGVMWELPRLFGGETSLAPIPLPDGSLLNVVADAQVLGAHRLDEASKVVLDRNTRSWTWQGSNETVSGGMGISAGVSPGPAASVLPKPIADWFSMYATFGVGAGHSTSSTVSWSQSGGGAHTVKYGPDSVPYVVPVQIRVMTRRDGDEYAMVSETVRAVVRIPAALTASFEAAMEQALLGGGHSSVSTTSTVTPPHPQPTPSVREDSGEGEVSQSVEPQQQSYDSTVADIQPLPLRHEQTDGQTDEQTVAPAHAETTDHTANQAGGDTGEQTPLYPPAALTRHNGGSELLLGREGLYGTKGLVSSLRVMYRGLENMLKISSWSAQDEELMGGFLDAHFHPRSLDHNMHKVLEQGGFIRSFLRPLEGHEFELITIHLKGSRTSAEPTENLPLEQATVQLAPGNWSDASESEGAISWLGTLSNGVRITFTDAFDSVGRAFKARLGLYLPGFRHTDSLGQDHSVSGFSQNALSYQGQAHRLSYPAEIQASVRVQRIHRDDLRGALVKGGRKLVGLSHDRAQARTATKAFKNLKAVYVVPGPLMSKHPQVQDAGGENPNAQQQVQRPIVRFPGVVREETVQQPTRENGQWVFAPGVVPRDAPEHSTGTSTAVSTTDTRSWRYEKVFNAGGDEEIQQRLAQVMTDLGIPSELAEEHAEAMISSDQLIGAINRGGKSHTGQVVKERIIADRRVRMVLLPVLHAPRPAGVPLKLNHQDLTEDGKSRGGSIGSSNNFTLFAGDLRLLGVGPQQGQLDTYKDRQGTEGYAQGGYSSSLNSSESSTLRFNESIGQIFSYDLDHLRWTADVTWQMHVTAESVNRAGSWSPRGTSLQFHVTDGAHGYAPNRAAVDVHALFPEHEDTAAGGITESTADQTVQNAVGNVSEHASEPATGDTESTTLYGPLPTYTVTEHFLSGDGDLGAQLEAQLKSLLAKHAPSMKSSTAELTLPGTVLLQAVDGLLAPGVLQSLVDTLRGPGVPMMVIRNLVGASARGQIVVKYIRDPDNSGAKYVETLDEALSSHYIQSSQRVQQDRGKGKSSSAYISPLLAADSPNPPHLAQANGYSTYSAGKNSSDSANSAQIQHQHHGATIVGPHDSFLTKGRLVLEYVPFVRPSRFVNTILANLPRIISSIAQPSHAVTLPEFTASVDMYEQVAVPKSALKLARPRPRPRVGPDKAPVVEEVLWDFPGKYGADYQVTPEDFASKRVMPHMDPVRVGQLFEKVHSALLGAQGTIRQLGERGNASLDELRMTFDSKVLLAHFMRGGTAAQGERAQIFPNLLVPGGPLTDTVGKVAISFRLVETRLPVQPTDSYLEITGEASSYSSASGGVGKNTGTAGGAEGGSGPTANTGELGAPAGSPNEQQVTPMGAVSLTQSASRGGSASQRVMHQVETVNRTDIYFITHYDVVVDIRIDTSNERGFLHYPGGTFQRSYLVENLLQLDLAPEVLLAGELGTDKLADGNGALPVPSGSYQPIGPRGHQPSEEDSGQADDQLSQPQPQGQSHQPEQQEQQAGAGRDKGKQPATLGIELFAETVQVPQPSPEDLAWAAELVRPPVVFGSDRLARAREMLPEARRQLALMRADTPKSATGLRDTIQRIWQGLGVDAKPGMMPAGARPAPSVGPHDDQENLGDNPYGEGSSSSPGFHPESSSGSVTSDDQMSAFEEEFAQDNGSSQGEDDSQGNHQAPPEAFTALDRTHLAPSWPEELINNVRELGSYANGSRGGGAVPPEHLFLQGWDHVLALPGDGDQGARVRNHLVSLLTHLERDGGLVHPQSTLPPRLMQASPDDWAQWRQDHEDLVFELDRAPEEVSPQERQQVIDLLPLARRYRQDIWRDEVLLVLAGGDRRIITAGLNRAVQSWSRYLRTPQHAGSQNPPAPHPQTILTSQSPQQSGLNHHMGAANPVADRQLFPHARSFTDPNEAIEYGRSIWNAHVSSLPRAAKEALLAYSGGADDRSRRGLPFQPFTEAIKALADDYDRGSGTLTQFSTVVWQDHGVLRDGLYDDMLQDDEPVSMVYGGQFLRSALNETDRLLTAIDQVIGSLPVPEDVVVTRALTQETLDHLEHLAPSQVVRQGALMSTTFGPVADDFTDRPAVLHLLVPAGTAALYIGSVSASGDDERELLIGRGFDWQVVHVEQRDGRQHIYGRMNPAPPSAEDLAWAERQMPDPLTLNAATRAQMLAVRPEVVRRLAMERQLFGPGGPVPSERVGQIFRQLGVRVWPSPMRGGSSQATPTPVSDEVHQTQDNPYGEGSSSAAETGPAPTASGSSRSADWNAVAEQLSIAPDQLMLLAADPDVAARAAQSAEAAAAAVQPTEQAMDQATDQALEPGEETIPESSPETAPEPGHEIAPQPETVQTPQTNGVLRLRGGAAEPESSDESDYLSHLGDSSVFGEGDGFGAEFGPGGDAPHDNGGAPGPVSRSPEQGAAGDHRKRPASSPDPGPEYEAGPGPQKRARHTTGEESGTGPAETVQSPAPEPYDPDVEFGSVVARGDGWDLRDTGEPMGQTFRHRGAGVEGLRQEQSPDGRTATTPEGRQRNWDLVEWLSPVTGTVMAYSTWRDTSLPGVGSAGSLSPVPPHTVAALDADWDLIGVTPLWRQDDTPLYHFTALPVRTFAQQGLLPKGTGHAHLLDYVYSGRRDTLFASTTRNPGYVSDFTRANPKAAAKLSGYTRVFLLEPQGGIDVNATLDVASPYPDQQEVVFLGGVKPEFVRGWYDLQGGEPVSRPLTGLLDEHGPQGLLQHVVDAGGALLSTGPGEPFATVQVVTEDGVPRTVLRGAGPTGQAEPVELTADTLAEWARAHPEARIAVLRSLTDIPAEEIPGEIYSEASTYVRPPVPSRGTDENTAPGSADEDAAYRSALVRVARVLLAPHPDPAAQAEAARREAAAAASEYGLVTDVTGRGLGGGAFGDSWWDFVSHDDPPTGEASGTGYSLVVHLGDRLGIAPAHVEALGDWVPPLAQDGRDRDMSLDRAEYVVRARLASLGFEPADLAWFAAAGAGPVDAAGLAHFRTFARARGFSLSRLREAGDTVARDQVAQWRAGRAASAASSAPQDDATTALVGVLTVGTSHSPETLSLAVDALGADPIYLGSLFHHELDDLQIQLDGADTPGPVVATWAAGMRQRFDELGLVSSADWADLAYRTHRDHTALTEAYHGVGDTLLFHTEAPDEPNWEHVAGHAGLEADVAWFRGLRAWFLVQQLSRSSFARIFEPDGSVFRSDSPDPQVRAETEQAVARWQELLGELRNLGHLLGDFGDRTPASAPGPHTLPDLRAQQEDYARWSEGINRLAARLRTLHDAVGPLERTLRGLGLTQGRVLRRARSLPQLSDTSHALQAGRFPARGSTSTVRPGNAFNAATQPVTDAGIEQIEQIKARSTDDSPGAGFQWRTDRDVLYRWSGDTPETVREHGLVPRGDGHSMTLRKYVRNGHMNQVAWVSSTRTDAVTLDQSHGRYRYTFHAPGGLDVRRTLDRDAQPHEEEVIFFGGIAPRFITRVERFDGGGRLLWSEDWTDHATGDPQEPGHDETGSNGGTQPSAPADVARVRPTEAGGAEQQGPSQDDLAWAESLVRGPLVIGHEAVALARADRTAIVREVASRRSEFAGEPQARELARTRWQARGYHMPVGLPGGMDRTVRDNGGTGGSGGESSRALSSSSVPATAPESSGTVQDTNLPPAEVTAAVGRRDWARLGELFGFSEAELGRAIDNSRVLSLLPHEWWAFDQWFRRDLGDTLRDLLLVDYPVRLSRSHRIVGRWRAESGGSVTFEAAQSALDRALSPGGDLNDPLLQSPLIAAHLAGFGLTTGDLGWLRSVRDFDILRQVQLGWESAGPDPRHVQWASALREVARSQAQLLTAHMRGRLAAFGYEPSDRRWFSGITGPVNAHVLAAFHQHLTEQGTSPEELRQESVAQARQRVAQWWADHPPQPDTARLASVLLAVRQARWASSGGDAHPQTATLTADTLVRAATALDVEPWHLLHLFAFDLHTLQALVRDHGPSSVSVVQWEESMRAHLRDMGLNSQEEWALLDHLSSHFRPLAEASQPLGSAAYRRVLALAAAFGLTPSGLSRRPEHLQALSSDGPRFRPTLNEIGSLGRDLVTWARYSMDPDIPDRPRRTRSEAEVGQFLRNLGPGPLAGIVRYLLNRRRTLGHLPEAPVDPEERVYVGTDLRAAFDELPPYTNEDLQGPPPAYEQESTHTAAVPQDGPGSDTPPPGYTQSVPPADHWSLLPLDETAALDHFLRTFGLPLADSAHGPATLVAHAQEVLEDATARYGLTTPEQRAWFYRLASDPALAGPGDPAQRSWDIPQRWVGPSQLLMMVSMAANIHSAGPGPREPFAHIDFTQQLSALDMARTRIAIESGQDHIQLMWPVAAGGHAFLRDLASEITRDTGMSLAEYESLLEHGIRLSALQSFAQDHGITRQDLQHLVRATRQLGHLPVRELQGASRITVVDALQIISLVTLWPPLRQDAAHELNAVGATPRPGTGQPDTAPVVVRPDTGPMQAQGDHNALSDSGSSSDSTRSARSARSAASDVSGADDTASPSPADIAGLARRWRVPEARLDAITRQPWFQPGMFARLEPLREALGVHEPGNLLTVIETVHHVPTVEEFRRVAHDLGLRDPKDLHRALKQLGRPLPWATLQHLAGSGTSPFRHAVQGHRGHWVMGRRRPQVSALTDWFHRHLDTRGTQAGSVLTDSDDLPGVEHHLDRPDDEDNGSDNHAAADVDQDSILAVLRGDG